VVDYLQLVVTDGGESRVQEIGQISRALKALARELRVPIVALSQLSRAVEQRTPHIPQLSDLRESGCLVGDTLIALASGELAPIVSLCGQTPEVVTLDGWRITTSVASKVWRTGFKRVFKLRMRGGRTVRATGNHKFRTLTGWMALDEVQIGDRLAIPRRDTQPSAPASHFSFAPSRDMLGEYAHRLRADDLKAIADSDLFWDEVRAIEPDGEEDVYDMTVRGTHNFVANGIIAHNSLEQDADVVLFIYRDEKYNPDTDKKGVADIIVAKHRNGPTGQVQLLFLERTTKFLDLEVYRS